jgi:hypothetical protein
MKVVSQTVASIYLDSIKDQAEFIQRLLEITEERFGSHVSCEVKLTRHLLATVNNAIEHINTHSYIAPVIVPDNSMEIA